MLSLEQLKAAKVNDAVAREAYTQVDRYLTDLLATRNLFDQKATALMSAFITVSLALFGIGGAIFQKDAMDAATRPFFVTGLFFCWALVVSSARSGPASTPLSEARRKCGSTKRSSMDAAMPSRKCSLILLITITSELRCPCAVIL